VHNHELSSKIYKKRIERFNLALISTEKPAFDSSQHRFSHYEPVKKEPE
jgi:hypothetical protein